MPSIQLDLVWTVFAVFCGYSIYTPVVTFMWAEKGQRVFQNLRVPVIVFVYFLVPCAALLLLIMAFDGIREPTWQFVAASGLVLSLSFIVMLYILTVPDWPIGRFLQIDRVPVGAIRALISVNFGASLLIAIVCATIVVQAPQAIEQVGQRGQELQQLEAQTQKLDEQKDQSAERISGIRAEAVRKVIDDNVKTVRGVLAALASGVGLVGSLRALGDKKKRRRRSNRDRD